MNKQEQIEGHLKAIEKLMLGEGDVYEAITNKAKRKMRA